MQHKLEHADPPTWCCNCGTFDVYAVGECSNKHPGEFDSRVLGNAEKLVAMIYGKEEVRDAAIGEND
jgi:hypothetical protein